MAPRLTDQERAFRAIPEAKLQARFLADAHRLGWIHMHISDPRVLRNVDGQLRYVGDPECAGWPDLFLAHIAAGRVLGVEVKRETEDVTEAQDRWLNALDAAGIDTLVLRPSNYEVGLELLRRDVVLVAA